jgi:hypothetical protein
MFECCEESIYLLDIFDHTAVMLSKSQALFKDLTHPNSLHYNHHFIN